MTVTPAASHQVRPSGAGSSTGFVLIALGALVAAVGVVQLEVQGAPWPAQQAAGLGGGQQAARPLGDPRQARTLSRDDRSEAASASGR